jgi:hypothetical protein
MKRSTRTGSRTPPCSTSRSARTRTTRCERHAPPTRGASGSLHPGPRAKVHVQLESSCLVTAGLQLRVPENATPGVRLALDRVDCDGHGKLIGTRDRGWRRVSATLAPRAQKQFLDLLPRPGLAAQEDEARAQAGIVGEATDRNSSSELFPAVASAQLFDHPLEGDSVERVPGVSPACRWRFLPVVIARVLFVVRLWHAPSVPWPSRARRASERRSPQGCPATAPVPRADDTTVVSGELGGPGTRGRLWRDLRQRAEVVALADRHAVVAQDRSGVGEMDVNTSSSAAGSPAAAMSLSVADDRSFGLVEHAI